MKAPVFHYRVPESERNNPDHAQREVGPWTPCETRTIKYNYGIMQQKCEAYPLLSEYDGKMPFSAIHEHMHGWIKPIADDIICACRVIKEMADSGLDLIIWPVNYLTSVREMAERYIVRNTVNGRDAHVMLSIRDKVDEAIKNK